MRNDTKFLEQLRDVLDAALAPREPIDYNAQFARQQAERTTSLKVYRMGEVMP